MVANSRTEKGQTLALLDDGCKLSMPEWAAQREPKGRSTLVRLIR